MESFRDVHSRPIRLTEERHQHLLAAHPEMADTVFRIAETLASPDKIVRSVTDEAVELFYKHYPSTPVTSKFLCIVVKFVAGGSFIITAYYTDTIKRGESLWQS
jgi:hypothetical protein